MIKGRLSLKLIFTDCSEYVEIYTDENRYIIDRYLKKPRILPIPIFNELKDLPFQPIEKLSGIWRQITLQITQKDFFDKYFYVFPTLQSKYHYSSLYSTRLCIHVLKGTSGTEDYQRTELRVARGQKMFYLCYLRGSSYERTREVSLEFAEKYIKRYGRPDYIHAFYEIITYVPSEITDISEDIDFDSLTN